MARIRKASAPAQPTKIWQMAIYLRLSKDDGQDESTSIMNQRKIITEYLEQSFDEEHTIVDFYIDDGLTGTDDERIAFQRMIQDVKSGKVNCIICKNLARAFRNYADQGYFLEELFPLYSTRFICLGSPCFDTYKNPDSVTDGMDVPISGLMNDRYAARTSADIRQTFNTKRRKGEFIGAFAPYGYKKDPLNKNALIIDEEPAQVIRDIYRWRVLESMSKLSILRRLNQLGIPTPTQYKHSQGLMLKTPLQAKNDGMWGLSTICTILKNRVYIGDMVQGRQKTISYKVHKTISVPEEEWFIVENTHEPIVNKDLFKKAQELDQRDIRIAPEVKQVYLFSGFLRCADCGRGMTKKTTNRKKRDGTISQFVYYVCGTYAFKNKEKCTNHSIKLEHLEEAVLKAIQQQIALVENMAEVIAEINTQPTIINQSKQLTQQLITKENELNKLTITTDQLYMDWKCGEINREEYLRMKASFKTKIKIIKQQIATIQSEIKLNKQGITNDNSYLKTFLTYKNIQSLDRNLLLELIDMIEIHENKEITIHFKFADQYQRLVEFIRNNRSVIQSKND